MTTSAAKPRETSARRNTNRFDSTIPGESGWHSHDGGQFILVESGISHVRTEIGAWIIPSRRIGWLPPNVRHSSRTSGRGRGWVILAPAEFAKSLPRQVCVLRASALLTASLERLTRLASNDGRMRRLLWRVVAAEMRGARPEPLEVPMPSTPRILKAAQGVLETPTITADLDRLAGRAGMSRRSFTRHFRSETGLSFSRWKRTVIAHHALERIASGHKVSAVAFDAGYESVSAFIAMFRRKFGAAPREFLNQHFEHFEHFEHYLSILA
jgi:AraC-like DNA-binding protein